jgi:pilus assembly protein CpaC
MTRQAQTGRIGPSTRFRRGLFILIIALLGDSTTLWAQARPVPMASVGAAAAAEPEANAVRLLVGRSTVIDIGSPIARVSLTSADIADAMVTSPNQLLLNGKMPGTISLFVWDRSGAIRRYEVIVQRDLSHLTDHVRQLFPGEPIAVQSTGRSIVLSGSVSSKDVIDKAVDLAGGYVEKKDEVVNLLKLQENAASNQVLLRVRFAEVSRSALTELAISAAANGYNNGRWFGRTTTEEFAAPSWDSQGRFVFSDFLNLFLFDAKKELAGVVRALQSKGLFQSLAEPNLVSESGKEASFLAGGEFPVPIAQPSGAGTTTITVVFKEFGIRLTFTPVIVGDRVHLKVKPEVSTLDFGNAVTLQGFKIPALSTRRTETELELQDGQTFAIAGLLNNTMSSTLQKIPGIGDIPILGLLFRSKSAQKDQTELVVMITPQILPRNSRGVSSTLPRTLEPFLAPVPDKKTQDPLPPAFEPGRKGDPAAAGGPNPQIPKAQAAKPAGSKPSASTKQSSDASRTMEALTPGAPKPATAAGPGAAAPAPEGSTRVVNTNDERVLDRARREQLEKMKAEQLSQKAAQQRLLAKQAEDDRRRVEQARIEQKKLEGEKAKRDEAQAKLTAAKAKRDAEAAREQAEIQKKHQKEIDDAAAKLKAAQAAYDAEVAKKGGTAKDKQQQDKQ